MPFAKGQSGNPGGRPKMDPEIREAIGRNGELAIKRMQQILKDKTAWGPAGWMKPREQIMLAGLAQERAYGKSAVVHIDHVHDGAVDVRHKPQFDTERIRRMADQLPERRAQRSALEAKVINPE
ncbi:MAG: DUF5681 domain-containing protein [Pseudomonadota bacterium]